MTLFEFLILLVIAAICGYIGQSIAGYSLGGWIISAGVGLIGAVIGKWLASELGIAFLLPLEIDGNPFPVAWSIAGSALFAVAISLITRKR